MQRISSPGQGEKRAFDAVGGSVEDTVERKKRRMVTTRKAQVQTDILTGEGGVKQLLAMCDSDAVRGSGVPGRELGDLQRLLFMYKKWAHDLCPKKSSAEFIHDLRDLSALRMHQGLQTVAEGKHLDAHIHTLNTQYPMPNEEDTQFDPSTWVPPAPKARQVPKMFVQPTTGSGGTQLFSEVSGASGSSGAPTPVAGAAPSIVGAGGAEEPPVDMSALVVDQNEVFGFCDDDDDPAYDIELPNPE